VADNNGQPATPAAAPAAAAPAAAAPVAAAPAPAAAVVPVQESETDQPDELQLLHDQVVIMQQRFDVHIQRLLSAPGEPATNKDMANLFSAMSGDVLSILDDSLMANKESLDDVWDEIEKLDGDSGDVELDEVDVQVYAALVASVNLFQRLVAVPDNSPEIKKACEDHVELNLEAMKALEGKFGEDAIKEAMIEALKQVQGGGDGAVATTS